MVGRVSRVDRGPITAIGLVIKVAGALRTTNNVKMQLAGGFQSSRAHMLLLILAFLSLASLTVASSK